jgi:peptide/nickel transport system substrate-binding protein
MENRFGIKDFFLFGLLAVVIALIVLCIVQYDRQWKRLDELSDRTLSLTNDLTQIRRLLAEGIAVQPAPSNGAASTTQQASAAAPARPDAFGALKEAEKMPGFARGDWLVENFGTNLGRITPLITTDVYGSVVQAKVTEPLAQRDPTTLEYAPMLATNWTVSPDGKEITFDLRRGVTFSDGQPFTSADVVFTYELIKNPQIDAPRARSYLEHLVSVKADGDYRVVFTFNKFIFNTFETVSGTSILAKHFYSKYQPREYNENPGLLIGTGPYRMATPDGWRPGTGRIELVRNERYWGVQPPFDRLVYYEVKDDVVEETMFRNREIDRFGSTPEQFVKLKDEPAITSRSNAFDYYSPLGGYTYIGWNQRKKVGEEFKPSRFADVRVRRALTMLIDRERMARELWFGHATPASGPFGYGTPQNNPDVKPLPFDVDGAKALLKEAGFEDRNKDNLLESPEGAPFEFTFSYPSGNPFTDRVVLFIKDSYAKVGIKVNLDAVDWPIFIKKLDNRDFEACTLGWTTSVETDCNQIFHSSQTKDNGDNFVGHINPELDKAIDEARATVDDAERMKKWQVVHRIVAEDQPYTFLLNRKSLQFVDSRIKNVKPSKLGLNYVWTEFSPYPWFVPADQQLHKTAN